MNSVAAVFVYPCAKIPDFAYDYLEHRLPVVTALRFRTHLRFCKDCTEFIHLYRMAANPQEFLSETAVPEALVEHTLAFLEREMDKEG
jgi:hypothetical protein